MSKQTVFFLSDHTGITVEKLGHSLLTQFDGIEFTRIRVPYINNQQKATETLKKINAAYTQNQQQPIVISSIIDAPIRSIIQQANCIFFDFFDTFIPPMEKALGQSAAWAKGRAHGLINQSIYHARIDAVDFTLKNDDGANIRHYDKADLILVGVSRTGKTPTCLYLAMQFGLHAANYPLNEDDLTSCSLPKAISAYRNKVFGLTIDAHQLQMIRRERLPESRYATINQCRQEITAAEELYQLMRIPFIDTTTISIEEISTLLMDKMQLPTRIN
jgi:regulator of PEP synthase PpsR (kinase-PPPase family)